MRVLRRAFVFCLSIALASCGPPPGDVSPPPEATEARFAQGFATLPGAPLLPPGRSILVNIPSYDLVAFEDGTPVLRSRVIVGKPETRTPRIDTYTSAVLFWPAWRPTPEMIASGEVPDRVFPPGPDNPMGLLAIRLAPGLDVFMHDTNQRYLFDRDRRAFSHGCIRVERWAELAAWVLDRDVEEVRALASGPVSRITPAPPVPVLIRYLRTFPGEDGSLRTYPDIYGLGTSAAPIRVSGKDAPLSCALAAG